MNLERARLLSPASDLIAQELAQVRAAANLPSNEPRMAGTATQLLRADQWGELALVGLMVVAGAVIAVVRKVVGRSAEGGFVLISAGGRNGWVLRRGVETLLPQS